jgi:hypothetical protein
MIMRAPLIRVPASGWAAERGGELESLMDGELMGGVLQNLLGSVGRRQNF